MGGLRDWPIPKPEVESLGCRTPVQALQALQDVAWAETQLHQPQLCVFLSMPCSRTLSRVTHGSLRIHHGLTGCEAKLVRFIDTPHSQIDPTQPARKCPNSPAFVKHASIRPSGTQSPHFAMRGSGRPGRGICVPESLKRQE